MNQVKPLHEHKGASIDAALDFILLISPIPKTKTDSGLEIPDKAQRPVIYGYVARVGPEVKGVAQGDWVMFFPNTVETLFVNKQYGVLVNVIPEQGVACRMTTEMAQAAGCHLDSTDIKEVIESAQAVIAQ